MEESGEQCTVVFALNVTEPASGGGGGGCALPQPLHTHKHSLAGSETISAMMSVHCSPDASTGQREWGIQTRF